MKIGGHIQLQAELTIESPDRCEKDRPENTRTRADFRPLPAKV